MEKKKRKKINKRKEKEKDQSLMSYVPFSYSETLPGLKMAGKRAVEPVAGIKLG